MKTEVFSEMLSRSPLFQGCETVFLRRLIEEKRIALRPFAKDDILYDPDTTEKSVGILLEGEAFCYSLDPDRQVLLRRFSPPDSYGVANLFLDSPFVSRIVAKSRGMAAVISADNMMRLLREEERIMRNYIVFLSERIVFLNRKINTVTGGSAERRLAHFLCSGQRDGKLVLSLPMSRLAELLDIGRASLYRAFETLIEHRLIVRDGREISIPDVERLSQYFSF